MGKRQHRCPFYLLKITQNDLAYINKIKAQNEKTLLFYDKQINSLTQQFLSLKTSITKIIEILNPFLVKQEPLSLEECVEKSFLNKKTKRSTLSLIKKYKTYCKDKNEKEIEKSNGELNANNISTIFDPQNAFDFVVNKNKYQRSSIKKNLNILLRFIRLATKNPYLNYDLPIGIGEPVKLKHIITKEELIKFFRFLNSKRLYVIIVMCLLMYKFGLRVGALAKLKVSDLMPNGIIIFREKNNNVIKRALIKETFDILNIMIRELELDEDQYMFYFFKFEDNEDKRCFFLPKN